MLRHDMLEGMLRLCYMTIIIYDMIDLQNDELA